MKIVILGGVAAGTKTAAKLKREDWNAEVVLITKSKEISYAGCGLPYYVGGLIESRDELIVNTPKQYSELTGVQVEIGKEAIGLDAERKTVLIRDVDSMQTEEVAYDRLVIATGASAVRLNLEGSDLDGIYTVRTPQDAVSIRNAISEHQAKRAVVIGGGFIGLEMAENLKRQGCAVTVLEAASQILPGVFDEEIAGYIKKETQKTGIRIMTHTMAERFMGEGKVASVLTNNGNIACDLVVVSAGIRPNTEFLNECGLKMDRGRILTDAAFKTNLEDVYAVGDCAMVQHRMTKAAQYSPMGSSANLEGRTLAQILGGKAKSYPGVLGTAILKLPELNCGRTGLLEKQAKEAGYDVETALSISNDKAHYYPDASVFITKMIADKKTHQLLGVQVIGSGNVDKMVDIAVTGLNMNASLEDFENADYAYAPPFSTAIHPFTQAASILLNKIEGIMKSMTPKEYLDGKANDYKILDVASAPSIRGARFVDLASFDGNLPEYKKDEKLLLVCTKGKRAYFAQRRMMMAGYTNTLVLEGATAFNDVKVKNVALSVTPEEVTKVKAWGFLHDKNTADCFNGRVITRNGKITAEESAVIAEAAKRFGSGEITMTSRLTLEIQKVPYENIEPLREFLAEHGLETGGTGSKVRPVVSCKGTTCQYGLIDTFDLSEEIHERFYHGYHDVKLPHKFKIAVGGCPNNCVKPDLNDLGIIGQRVPEIDLDKCRGCKVCQVESACPIKIAHLEDGKIKVDPNACNHCGRCIGKCPFKAFEHFTNGYRVFIGGRWGKKTAKGLPLSKVFTDKNEVLDVVEKAILLFREQGITGERFADTVNRIGFENVESQLLDQGLLNRKEENLAAQVHLKGGAKC